MDAVDKNGRTPLMMASGANLIPAMQVLLGINNSNNSKKSMLSDSDSPESQLNLELEHNPQVDSLDISDVEGNSCLHFAYATGAASSIVLIESIYRNARRFSTGSSSSTSSDVDRVNIVGDTPTDNAGKISYMIPVLPHRYVYSVGSGNCKGKSHESVKSDKYREIEVPITGNLTQG